MCLSLGASHLKNQHSATGGMLLALWSLLLLSGWIRHVFDQPPLMHLRQLTKIRPRTPALGECAVEPRALLQCAVWATFVTPPRNADAGLM